MALKAKLKKNIRDWGATAIGLAVALAMAYKNIDWANFDISKEWPELLFDGIIATGGYLSTIKVFGKKTDESKGE